ncbi:MAG: AbrB/MazE/SpoVT family DNA-binding domain-containing protein [Candidatus Nanoarchaeia archaeon]|nr:AbrB/MazE/SpoVT family DNA-binding domain-containing protein [Candidatus Nanoarchaeia archaeon]
MKDLEFTRLSSKGQIVIPQDIRKDMELKTGTPFAVIEQKGSILLKKIEMPKIKSWEEATKPFKEAAKKAGFNKNDLDILIEEVRSSK